MVIAALSVVAMVGSHTIPGLSSSHVGDDSSAAFRKALFFFGGKISEFQHTFSKIYAFSNCFAFHIGKYAVNGNFHKENIFRQCGWIIAC